jgi:hypothetical protein
VTIVDPDVVGGGMVPVIEIDAGEIQQLEHGRLLLRRRHEERPDVSPRDHQRVARRDRERITERERKFALENQAVARQAAERALGVHGRRV